MPKTDEGKRFTDLAYATKDDVKAVYNKEDVQKEWDKVLSYRAFFTMDCEMRDNDGNDYFLTLSPAILKECYDLEERLFQDLLLYLSLSKEGQESFALKRKEHALLALSHHSLDRIPTEETLARLAKGEIQNVPTSLFLLGEYARTYDRRDLGMDVDGLIALNNLIQGEKEEASPLYRRADREDVVNILEHPLADRIPQKLSAFFLFLEQKDIPLLAKAVLSLYFFLSVLPFEYVDEETGALFSKNLLYTAGLSEVGFGLDFESVLFARSPRFYGRMKETEKTLDLTYVLAFVMPFLSKDEEGMRSLLRKEKEEDAQRKVVKTPLPKETADPGELALPAFQLDDDKKTIEERTKKLLEVYPFLKKKEAHFYAAHCKIGSFYTIEDFKTSEDTVYETARSSMEDLAKKGFYRKEKQGKKFVYAPIPMKEDTRK